MHCCIWFEREGKGYIAVPAWGVWFVSIHFKYALAMLHALLQACKVTIGFDLQPGSLVGRPAGLCQPQKKQGQQKAMN
eukprot:1146798-Pelagomonas_calceolata.AAC.3